MPTIIECITQAEAKGAELKKQAAARAKEITDDAEARRGRTIKEAHDAGRAMIQRILMFERSERHTSKPSASGIIRSVMTIWGQILSALAMPSLPFAAVYTL